MTAIATAATACRVASGRRQAVPCPQLRLQQPSARVRETLRGHPRIGPSGTRSIERREPHALPNAACWGLWVERSLEHIKDEADRVGWAQLDRHVRGLTRLVARLVRLVARLEPMECGVRSNHGGDTVLCATRTLGQNRIREDVDTRWILIVVISSSSAVAGQIEVIAAVRVVVRAIFGGPPARCHGARKAVALAHCERSVECSKRGVLVIEPGARSAGDVAQFGRD